MTPKEHWKSIYTTKAPNELSWFQPRPELSLELIRRVAPRTDAAIIDVGGASTLVDALLTSGYTRLAVSDIAAAGPRHAQMPRGRGRICHMEMLRRSRSPPAFRGIRRLARPSGVSLPHLARSAALPRTGRARRPADGHVIIGTFADDGPRRCSGLDVVRYSAAGLHAEFERHFELIDRVREEHITPGASHQAFQYCVCTYRPAAIAAAVTRSSDRGYSGRRRGVVESPVMTKKPYGIRKICSLPFETAVEKITEALKEEGFGVLTEIDIKAKLKEKLGVDFRKYVILGACNPPLAYKALQAEPEIGLLLPCNVIVYEVDARNSVVSAVDPNSMLELVGDNQLVREVARDARKRLEAALARMKDEG